MKKVYGLWRGKSWQEFIHHTGYRDFICSEYPQVVAAMKRDNQWEGEVLEIDKDGMPVNPSDERIVRLERERDTAADRVKLLETFIDNLVEVSGASCPELLFDTVSKQAKRIKELEAK